MLPALVYWTFLCSNRLQYTTTPQAHSYCSVSPCPHAIQIVHYWYSTPRSFLIVFLITRRRGLWATGGLMFPAVKLLVIEPITLHQPIIPSTRALWLLDVVLGRKIIAMTRWAVHKAPIRTEGDHSSVKRQTVHVRTVEWTLQRSSSSSFVSSMISSSQSGRTFYNLINLFDFLKGYGSACGLSGPVVGSSQSLVGDNTIERVKKGGGVEM